MLRIRELRLGRGMAAVDLARLAGIDPRTLSAIETGRNGYPSGRTLAKIADALGVNMGDLWTTPTDAPDTDDTDTDHG